MRDLSSIGAEFIVDPDAPFKLDKCEPDWADLHELRGLDKDAAKERAGELLAETLAELHGLQELLWASGSHAVLIILQAMDAGGKDSLIEHVMSGMNPQGCVVHSFKQPSTEELAHTFLWRCMKAAPPRGQIGIFNRSHYEEVTVVRVHPDWLDKQHLPADQRGKDFWKNRYRDIRAFERHLVRNGTVVLKFFLNLSKAEQKRRFLARLDRPEKNWKFSAADVDERALWDKYMRAYERAIRATSTPWAPWYVLPADHKWIARLLAANILTAAIRGLDLKYPQLTDEQRRVMDECKQRLMAEE
jgi:PPK2 family polyphosphate:nucleotide phosphotransferase